MQKDHFPAIFFAIVILLSILSVLSLLHCNDLSNSNVNISKCTAQGNIMLNPFIENLAPQKDNINDNLICIIRENKDILKKNKQ